MKKIVGAMFSNEKIWRNNSELYIDEMFVILENESLSMLRIAKAFLSKSSVSSRKVQSIIRQTEKDDKETTDETDEK